MDIEKQEAEAKKVTAQVVFLRGALKAVERTIREAERQRREILSLLDEVAAEEPGVGAG